MTTPPLFLLPIPVTLRTVPHYVYIMGNAERAIYIGMTNNLTRRVREHQQERKRAFTSWFNLRLLVYHERLPDLLAARAREKELKRWARPRKLELILSKNPNWRDLSSQLLPGKRKAPAPKRRISSRA